jgi:hypothetical protein
MVYKYGFEEYWKAAEKNPTQENIGILAEWVMEFGEWNGDSYIIDKDKRICLKPIEYFNGTRYPIIIGWELKNY